MRGMSNSNELNLILLDGVKNVNQLPLEKFEKLASHFPTSDWQKQTKILETFYRRLKRSRISRKEQSIQRTEQVEYRNPYDTKDKEFAKLSLEERKAIIGEDLQAFAKKTEMVEQIKEDKINEFETNEVNDFIVSFLEKSLPMISEEKVLTGYNIFIHGSIPRQIDMGKGEIIDRIRKLHQTLYSENTVYQFIEDNYGKNLQTRSN